MWRSRVLILGILWLFISDFRELFGGKANFLKKKWKPILDRSLGLAMIINVSPWKIYIYLWDYSCWAY